MQTGTHTYIRTHTHAHTHTRTHTHIHTHAHTQAHTHKYKTYNTCQSMQEHASKRTGLLRCGFANSRGGGPMYTLVGEALPLAVPPANSYSNMASYRQCKIWLLWAKLCLWQCPFLQTVNNSHVCIQSMRVLVASSKVARLAAATTAAYHGLLNCEWW